MSFILSLNNKIKILNKNVENFGNRMSDKEKEIKSINNQLEDKEKEIKSINNQLKDKDKEITSINNQLKDKDKELSSLKRRIDIMERNLNYNIYLECRNTINNFSYSKPGLFINICKKKEIINKNIVESWENLYDTFEKLTKYYLEIKRIDGKKILYNDIESFIGIEIMKKEDINKWKEIKEKLNIKMENNTIFSKYYRGLLEFLYGIKYINSNNDEDMDLKLIFNNSNIRYYIKKLILFLEFCNDNIDLIQIEGKFQAIIFYICYKMNIKDNIIIDLCKLQKNDDNEENREIVSKLISSLNENNLLKC